MAIPRAPAAADRLRPEPPELLVRAFNRFTARASAGGIVLIVCATVALFWANIAPDDYHAIFHGEILTIGVESLKMAKSIEWWINDALMAMFFFVVGLEIKREMMVGELASPKKASLPIAAALGGMVVPGAIYAAINWGQPTFRGWGIPMATDIAFALGILSLVGTRAPLSLRVFLTSLAIVDDLGALVVIAVFYTENLAMDYLAYSGLALAGMIALNLLRVRTPIIYLFFGIALWYLVYQSGVHATIAGVAGAMAIPSTARVGARDYLDSTRHALDVLEARAADPRGELATSAEQRAAVYAVASSSRQVLPVLNRLEDAMHPWVAFAIIPIFALANAGVSVSGDLGAVATGRIGLGVFFGLLIGKPVGILLFSYLAVRLRIAAMPAGITYRHLLGAGLLGGVGFTMALFIANLAFPGGEHANPELEASKLAILAGSTVSAIAGLIVLFKCPRVESPSHSAH